MHIKKVLILLIVILLLAIPLYFYNKSANSKQVLENGHPQKTNGNMISMMYETAAGSGEYVASNNQTWLSSEYIFNETLSKCENGSRISWNDEKGTVTLKANISDKCYAYFDKVAPIPVITSATFGTDNGCSGYTALTNVTFDREGEVSKYYVSFNEENYEETDIIPNFSSCSGGGGSLNLCYGQTFNYSIYAVLADGRRTNNFEGSYTTPTCFVAGTLVYTEDGYKNIEDIQIGDEVYSYNEFTKNVELNKVVKTFVHQDNEIYEIKLGKETIKVTPDHRVFAKTKNSTDGKWIKVEKLNEGDYLFNSNGKFEKINSIKFYNEKNTVYNIEVANNHTYYVTKSNYLVHNAKYPNLAGCLGGITSTSLVIESYDLSLSWGAANYLENVVINEDVEVEKYVLILDNDARLEALEQGQSVWKCVDNTTCFNSLTKYDYEFYLITTDGRQSESRFGTLETDKEIAGPILPPIKIE